MFSCLEALNFAFDVLHNSRFSLQDVEECLPLISLSHFFHKFESFILLLQLILIILKLMKFFLQLGFFQRALLLVGVKFRHVGLYVALDSLLKFLEDVGALRIHD